MNENKTDSQMSQENKATDKKISSEGILEEVQALLDTANGAAQGEEELKEQAGEILQQADILVQMQNASDNGVLEETELHIPENQKELFEQIRVMTEADNAIANGADKKDGYLRRLADETEEAEYNPETVIDEKIKEEQKDDVLEALKNDIVSQL